MTPVFLERDYFLRVDTLYHYRGALPAIATIVQQV